MSSVLAAVAQWESKRLHLQAQLDSAKTQEERNRLGQFATPAPLAEVIIRSSLPLLPDQKSISYLDPAFGTGSFYSALLRLVDSNRIERAWGFEVDPHYGIPTIELWRNTSLQLSIADFFSQSVPNNEEEKPNFLICNPPYVRHHHIPAQKKKRLQMLVREQTGISLSGLAGLYCYFMLLADRWMSADGVACWLIPSEFLDVNYGAAIKQYLLDKVTLLRIHRFNPENVQFADALVSSVLVWLRKGQPSPTHRVTFTYGENPAQPEKTVIVTPQELQEQPKWSVFGHPTRRTEEIEGNGKLRLADLFHIKRGIATGANNFFILTPQQIEDAQLPGQFLKPILPSPRYLSHNEIETDNKGNPILNKRLFLLDCNWPEALVQAHFPHLWRYLQYGIAQGIPERYLCSRRSPWYSQEQRPPAPLLCTYMGRQTAANGNHPFRFFLNHSQAIAANVYLLLYPTPQLREILHNTPWLLRSLWQRLNDLSADEMIYEGRTYGGSLHKLEPGELANTAIDAFFAFSKSSATEQLSLLESPVSYELSTLQGDSDLP